jgi:hypothetical protein
MAEGTSIHHAVSPFARRHPSSDLGRRERARGCPNLANNRTGDQGCPKRHEEGTCEIVRETRLAFSRALRPAACPEQVVARWSRRGNAAKANATGIGWCR